jgi:hypothetical protein
MLWKRFFVNRLAQDFDVIEIHFEREALPGRGESDDDFALVAKLRHNSLHAREDAPMHAHWFSHGYRRMGTQDASAGKALADPANLSDAHGVAHAVS